MLNVYGSYLYILIKRR